MNFWHWITRLGEAQILLPLMLVLALRWQVGHRPAAQRWLAVQCGVVALTTASKLAFIGWGVGWAALNFTGFSGHAMFAASVYPLLAGTMASNLSSKMRSAMVACGVLLALLVGASRLAVGAHSLSEVVAGLALGLLASAVGLRHTATPKPLGPLLPLAAGAWLVVMSLHAPAPQTHALVTRLALALSGHDKPYTRADMLRDHHKTVKSAAASGRTWVGS